MSRHRVSLLIIFSLSFSSALAAVPKGDARIWEELTGKKAGVHKAAASSAPEQHLRSGMEAFKKRDYIAALQHYNTVISRYGTSPQVRAAHLAKAQLYSRMGLAEAARVSLNEANRTGASFAR